MFKNLLFLFSILLITGLSAQNQLPQIQNFTFEFSGQQIIFNYDLFELDGENCEVFLRASADGVNYDVRPLVATGDVGEGIEPGFGKQITWTPTVEFLPGNREDFSFQLVADDGFKPDLQQLVNLIDTNQILNNFFQVYGNNHPRSPDHYEATRSNIFTHYLINGYQAEVDSFVFIGDEPTSTRQGLNIYGTKAGLVRADSTVLMTGHYDTVEDTPGADDNAMSVAVTMEAARILKNFQFRNTIRFANWDLEEEGLVGAMFYANSPEVIGTKSVINFDGMTIFKTEPNSQQVPTGFNLLFPDAFAKAEADSFRGNFITLIGDAFSSNLNADAVSAFETYTPGFRFIDITCLEPGCLVATDLRRSDHAPFWDKGIPSVFMTSTTEFRTDCYHQPCDTTFNVWFSGEVIKAATALLVEQAGIMHAGVAQAQSVVGVNENTTETEINFFPNPVVSSAFVKLNLDAPAQLNIKVFTLNGSEVSSVNKQLGAGKQTVVWQPNAIKDGNYAVKISLNGEQILAKQISFKLDDSQYSHSH